MDRRGSLGFVILLFLFLSHTRVRNIFRADVTLTTALNDVHLWPSFTPCLAIDTFVLETSIHGVYYSGPLQNGGVHSCVDLALSLSLFFLFIFDRNDKSKSLVYRFVVPSGRRLHLESLPRGRDLRHEPGERIVRLLLRHRLQGSRLLGGHRRVRAGWVITSPLSISWKILLRSGLRNESVYFSFFLSSCFTTRVINDSLDSKTMISLERWTRKISRR